MLVRVRASGVEELSGRESAGVSTYSDTGRVDVPIGRALQRAEIRSHRSPLRSLVCKASSGGSFPFHVPSVEECDT